jgi:ribosomal protein L32
VRKATRYDTGTRAAYSRCANCGHMRMRHGFRGTARCTMANYYLPEGGSVVDIVTDPCPCDTFKPLPKDDQSWRTNAKQGMTPLF